MSVVYLSGDYLPAGDAKVSVNDRGFLFGDGVYEVTPAYGGRLFRWVQHLGRLRRGLAAIGIDFEAAPLKQVKEELLARNGLDGASGAYVYVQVTRGTAPRTHWFPDPPVAPTVYAFANRFARPAMEDWARGISAVTVPDQRWARADIKAIALLANVLAAQAAVEAGAGNAIFVRDGIALEGSHNNLFAVFDGVLTTAPKSNYILHGITRDLLIELAGGMGIPVEERTIPLPELYLADEVFFSGTTTEVRPVVEIDGRRVGDGTVGPVVRRLYEGFLGVVQGGQAAG
ncbi:MAG: aminotransferase class IV [Gemmatimonadetes bacterium]|nr:aminotransferase class IV [Gemmatimonadota bacterium]